MDIKINFKLKYSQIIKLIYVLIVALFIALSFIIGKFIYKNVYLVIIQAETITILQKEVTTEIIDVITFEKVLKKLEEKQKKPSFEIDEIKNIFATKEVGAKNVIEQLNSNEVESAPEKNIKRKQENINLLP